MSRTEAQTKTDGPAIGSPFSRSPDTSGTMKIYCGNCGAMVIAFYGTEEDVTTEIVDTEKCGLYGADPFKKDNSKDAVIRLVA